MRWLGLVAVMMAVVSAQAAGPVKRLYVFGDSYSDMGRGYVDTNGPTAVVFLAQKLGLEMVASNAADVRGKSLNFAVSGATTGAGKGSPVEGGMLGFGMKNQVAEFVGMVRTGAVKFDPKTTVFFLAGGLNDSRMQTKETVANLETEMTALYAMGARRFRVAVLPTAIPGFRAVAVRLNPALAGIPAEMQGKLPGAEVETSRWGAFYDAVMMDAAKYGISDTTNACAGRVIHHEDPTPCAEPKARFYYHAGHPSMWVSEIVGGMLFEEMVGRGGE
ncbi:MAG: SGNH/GDSL hydrolase family protein [Acidobacteriota bacterium]